MAGGLVTGIVRGLQIVFAVVVLGASVSLAKGQVFGSVPATTSYAAFAGAWAILTALIGIVAIFVEAIPGMIMAGVDGLAALLLLAGGIAYAVGIKGVSCAQATNGADLVPLSDPIFYKLLNGGTLGDCPSDSCSYGFGTGDALKGRCELAEADTAFLFIAFVACVAMMALGFMSHKRGGGKNNMV